MTVVFVLLLMPDEVVVPLLLREAPDVGLEVLEVSVEEETEVKTDPDSVTTLVTKTTLAVWLVVGGDEMLVWLV